MASIVENFLDAAKKYRDKPALVQGDLKLTYSEVESYARKFAYVLKQNGLQPGERVALVVENCPEYAAMYYGAMMTGGVVMALNTTAKDEDILNWINHANASFVVGRPVSLGIKDNVEKKYHLYKKTDSGFAAVNDIESIWSQNDILNHLSLSNDLASIIYTSGTTGEPKGVMLSHHNLFSNMASINQYLPLIPEDVVLNVLPFYYSYGNTVLHTNLGIGATVYLENSMMYPVKIVESLQNIGATGFYGVGSIYALLLSRGKLEDFDLSTMRYLTLAGGPMAPAHIKRIMSNISSAEFYMMYGQTEATARLAYIPADLIEEKLGSAGKAIPGVTLEIRDESGKAVETGVVGEIYATGENIMMGYWNNQTLTQTVLTDGWLRTGDIASMDEDGYVYMTGRRTDMIKSGANRISPKEIEEKLAELDGIEESAAIGIPDDVMGQVIKVYVVKKDGAELTIQNVLKHCKDKLAQYKIPKHVEFIDALPKTPSGKLQRFRLLEN